MDLIVHTISRPYPGEAQCGDQAAWWLLPQRLVLALADGLGHGLAASKAACLAMKTVEKNLHYNCEKIFEKCNDALRDTRGAALTVAIVDLEHQTLEIGSVGNIRNRLLRQDKHLHFGSARGIVGAGYRLLTPETVPILAGDQLALFSDGIDELADIRAFLPANATQEVMQKGMQALLNACGRTNDDLGLLVYQHELLYKQG